MLYFIRHGKSQFNEFIDRQNQKYGKDFKEEKEYLQGKFSQKYLDTDLTQLGKKQTKQARNLMKDIPVDLIIVSPLLRALKTCFLIFQDKIGKIPIIVEPFFRQVLQSSCDIGNKLQESMKIFPFDYSNIKDKQAWWVHTIQDQEVKNIILKELQDYKGIQRAQKAIQLTINFSKENWNLIAEDQKRFKELEKRVLPEKQIQIKIIKEYLRKYKSIAIVCHSRCIQEYSHKYIHNCEIFKTSIEAVLNQTQKPKSVNN